MHCLQRYVAFAAEYLSQALLLMLLLVFCDNFLGRIAVESAQGFAVFKKTSSMVSGSVASCVIGGYCSDLLVVVDCVFRFRMEAHCN